MCFVILSLAKHEQPLRRKVAIKEKGKKGF